MTERIYLGSDEDPSEVLTELFAILGPDADQRLIVWVPGDFAVDVPDEVAEAYTKPKAKRAAKATKTAKAAPPPPLDQEE